VRGKTGGPQDAGPNKILLNGSKENPNAKACYSRRSFLAGAAALLAAPMIESEDHADFGPVRPPRPVPDIRVTKDDGVSLLLRQLVLDRATAIHLMFTRCTSICPMQGFIFERVQALIPGYAQRGIQLLSLSVDAEEDDPKALRRWLERFHASAGWVAAAPQVEDLHRLTAFFGGGRAISDNHATRVYMVNPQGNLVWQTLDLPTAEMIAEVLIKIPREASSSGTTEAGPS
jgi:protein SCO1/2